MNPRRLRSTGVLCTALATAAVVAGCGGDSVPGNAVAKVDGTAVTRTDFDHWMTVFAKSSTQSTDGSTASTATGVVPVPPDYKACVTAKRAALTKSKSKARPTDKQLSTQCKTEYDGLRDQSLGLLIASQWLQGEATDQGIKVTSAEVTKQIDTQRKQQYPKKADFEKALKASGFSMADLEFQTRLQTLQEKLVAKIQKRAGSVSAAKIKAYYDKNQSKFGSAETRNVLIVLTKDKATADKAKSAIQGGQAFAAVAKKYSTDAGSKNEGGKLTVTKGQQEPAFDDAVFKASAGDLLGPIKTQFGYYVVHVSKITKATQQSLKDATPTIKQVLVQEAQQKAVADFSETYRSKWTAKTTCREGFLVQGCKNAPKTSTTATSAATTPAQ